MITILVIVLLSGLLFLTVSTAKERARRLVCLQNQRQLAVALLLYAHEDRKGRLAPYQPKSWLTLNENWLQKSERLSVTIFFCPGTRNGRTPALNHYKDGSTYYPDLNVAALNRESTGGYSYNILPWFADMEDFWNGNDNSRMNSRFVPKTLDQLGAYTHTSEAFGLEGRKPGASAVWLLTDNDLISKDPFYPGPAKNHGSAGANVEFGDGHGEWVKRQKYVLSYEISQDNNRTRAHPRP